MSSISKATCGHITTRWRSNFGGSAFGCIEGKFRNEWICWIVQSLTRGVCSGIPNSSKLFNSEFPSQFVVKNRGQWPDTFKNLCASRTRSFPCKNDTCREPSPNGDGSIETKKDVLCAIIKLSFSLLLKQNKLCYVQRHLPLLHS